MKILSVTAQKPHSTGSGVYLTEVVKGLAELNYEQAVVGGIYETDVVEFPAGVEFYPVYFKTKQLPFPIPGMSDEMPYENTVYGQMTEEMLQQFQIAFEQKVKEAVDEFDPDIILCHHLYLLTARVREWCPKRKMIGISHGTDLRQMKKIPLYRSEICSGIQGLDYIMALQEGQKEEIKKVYGVSDEKLGIIGTGYDHKIFHLQEIQKDVRPIRIIFAGKLAEKKGVFSLLRAFSQLKFKSEDVILTLAGGFGNEIEQQEILGLIEVCLHKVEVLGMMPREELARLFGNSHIMVLPSFYEGLPLVILEAMACGAKVICSDLPGIKPWIDKNLSDHGIRFVEPPVMRHTDEARPESLLVFEQRLKVAIEEAVEELVQTQVVVHEGIEQLSWKGVCERLENVIEKL